MTVIMQKGDVSTMRKFKREQKPNGGARDVELDFGAASAKVAQLFEQGEYKLRIEGAKVIETKEKNILIALDLVDVDSGGRISGRPLWVDGPKSDAGNLTAENQHLVAQLLTLAKLPTAGNVSDLIPKLSGLEFDGRLMLSTDKRTGQSFNAIAAVYTDDAS
jgi:hypothetical protein